MITVAETEGQKRTRAARTARTQAKYRRWMEEMSASGWTVLSGLSYEELFILQGAVNGRCRELGMDK